VWSFRFANPRLGNNNTSYFENFAQILGCSWVDLVSLQENNNLCTLGLTMVTRDNFFSHRPPSPPVPPSPTPHFCGFVSRFGRLLVVFWLHRTCARKLVWSSFWTFMHLTNGYGMVIKLSYSDFFFPFMLRREGWCVGERMC